MIPLSVLQLSIPLASDTICRGCKSGSSLWAVSRGSGGKLHTEWKGRRRNGGGDADLAGVQFSVS